MARGIKLLVIVARRGPVGSRRDHRGFAGGGQWRKDASIGVERLVGDQRIGLHRGQQVVRPLQVVCLAAGQEEVDRVAQRVDQGVDLGAQSAALAPDCVVLTSFFWAPALCWWARTMVLSIIAYSLSASAARCWNIRSQTAEPSVELCPLTEQLRQIAPWHPGTKAVQHRLDEQPSVRSGHPDRAFAPRQQVFDPFPLVVTQSETPHRSAPNKLTAYESKKPMRRNRPRITQRRLTAECGNRDSPAVRRWRPPTETG